MPDPTTFNTIGDEPVEARIVAWVLGEASAFEEAELERLCEERPELLIFRRRMRALHGLLTDAEAAETDEEWKLPAEKRKALDEIFGLEKGVSLEAAKEARVRHSGRRVILAIAACLILTVIIAGLMAPAGVQKARGRVDKVVDFMPRSGGGGAPAKNSRARDESLSRNSPFTVKPPAAETAPMDETLPPLGLVEQGEETKDRQSRSELATEVRTKGIIYKSDDSSYRAAESLAAVEGQKKMDQQLQPSAPSQPTEDVRYKIDSAIADRKPSVGESAKQRQLAQMNETASPRTATGAATGVLPEIPQSDVTPLPARLAGLGASGMSGGMGGSGAAGGFGRPKDGPDAVPPTPGAAPLPTREVFFADDSKPTGSPVPAKQRAYAGKLLEDGTARGTGGMAASGGPVGGKYGKGSKDELSPPPPVLAAKRSTLAQPDGKPVNGPTPSLEKKEMAAPQEAMDSLAGSFDGDKDVAGDVGQLGRDKGAADKRDGSDFISPVDGTSVDGIPADSDQFAANGVTNGLRSGDQAINRSNIDAILNNPERTRAARARAMPSLSKNKEAEELEVADRGDVAKLEGAENLEKLRKSPAESAPDNSEKQDMLPKEREGQMESNLAANADDNIRAELMKSVEAAWEAPATFTGGSLRAGGESTTYSYFSDANSDTESEKLNRQPAMEFDGIINYGTPIQDPPVPELVDLMEEVPASENPYSTFSLNINDASFQTAKAAIDKGERPDPESIKPEQFYNAVDYGDPAPAADQAVAATIEQSAHPVIPGRSLVRVALRTGATGHSAAQPLRLTLLVDQSGSMVREDRRAAMEQALAQLGGLLTKNDVISVIGFSRLPRLLADGMTGDQAGKLGEMVNQTASEGGTNLEEAMKVGQQLALRHQLAGAQNRIVLFTDGAANLGNANPEKLAEQVKALRQKGIAFDIAGIGADGLNDRLLGELARHGNGRYYVVSDTKDAHFAQQLAGAFRPAAENVKVQVNFNPQRVGKYKLIGFEKDRLKTEDFRNDAVDAAELAAEESGVAIYQVETLPEGTGEIGEVSVRFRDVASDEMVERSWTIPNESSVSAFDRATPSMQLAVLSMLAAEKLRGGPLGDAIDFNQLAGPRATVKQVYGGSVRVADMLQVIEKLK